MISGLKSKKNKNNTRDIDIVYFSVVATIFIVLFFICLYFFGNNELKPDFKKARQENVNAIQSNSSNITNVYDPDYIIDDGVEFPKDQKEQVVSAENFYIENGADYLDPDYFIVEPELPDYQKEIISQENPEKKYGKNYFDPDNIIDY